MVTSTDSDRQSLSGEETTVITMFTYCMPSHQDLAELAEHLFQGPRDRP